MASRVSGAPRRSFSIRWRFLHRTPGSRNGGFRLENAMLAGELQSEAKILDTSSIRLLGFGSMQISLRNMHIVLALSIAAGSSLPALAADSPSVRISNGQIKAQVYLPDAKNGFYRSTRFDWSGVIGNLEYKGHRFYGPWFHKIDPAVYDFNYDDMGVVSAPFTAMVGPGEEFNTAGKALGFDEAKAGGTFIKIGVGVLRKPDDSKFDHSKTYEIVDGGKWTVKKTRDSVEFTQELSDPATGYGYLYQKTIRLIPGKPEMVLEHTLKNTGRKPIESTVYDHNFWTLDKLPPGPGLVIKFPFQIQATRPPNKDFAEIRGNQFVYTRELANKDRVTASFRGFGDTASDYDIRVENLKVGAGVRIRGDRPLSNVVLWSIRTVMAVEPYIAMSIEPGSEFTWKLTYDYYIFPAGKPEIGNPVN